MATRGVPEHILRPRLCFFVVALALLLCGLVMAYSASAITSISSGAENTSYLISQATYAGIGIAGALLIYGVLPFQIWEGNFTWYVWIACILLIAYAAVSGTSHGGATRWIIIAGRELQPSEFAKIGFALISCKLFNDFRSGGMDLQRFLILGAVSVLLPLAAIYIFQSDLGTTVICALCILAVAYFSEVDWRIIAGIVVIGAVLVILASTVVGYRSERMVYLDPWNDGEGGFGAGYQTIHSLFALADGGLFGVGLGNSREKFLYLPANNTDYVFAVVCEELGLVGALGIIILFALLLYFGLRISGSCTSPFGITLSGSLSIMLVAQAFLNIGCAISLFPMTGKPLPFFSVGGSSMISTILIIGFILAASRDAGMNSAQSTFDERRSRLRITTRVDDNWGAVRSQGVVDSSSRQHRGRK